MSKSVFRICDKHMYPTNDVQTLEIDGRGKKHVHIQ